MRHRPDAWTRCREGFTHLSRGASRLLGSPVAFLFAAAVLLGWAVTGPLFGWSDTWQLVVNTGTTIVTFLMVFLIQNTQNRDAAAIHLKLDELIRAVQGARNRLVDAEDLTDEDFLALQEEFHRLRERSAGRQPAPRKGPRVAGRGEGRRAPSPVPDSRPRGQAPELEARRSSR